MAVLAVPVWWAEAGDGGAASAEGGVAAGQNVPRTDDDKPAGLPAKLLVATKPAPPFAIKGADDQWQGLSIQLWERIAEALELQYEYVETDMPGMLEGLQKGRFHAAVAAATMTAEREQWLDFSHPFYSTGLGIALPRTGTNSLSGALGGIVSIKFLRALGGLLVVLLLVGVVVWAFERRANGDQFGGPTIKGIGAGFWWSAVTMTTVGYGDKAPVTLGGRLVGLVWMFASIITISGFTAAIASALTVRHLDSAVAGPEDLPGVRVGSVSDTTSAAYLRRARIPYRPFESAEDALAALAHGELDAVVYDAPILRYFVKTNHDDRLMVLGETFDDQNYALVFPAGSPLREDVNRLLLEQVNSVWWDDLVYRYLGR
jgi:ABC-type amino acid transport substrate-binding protein